ncbi:hypothetical protein BAC3_00652 [uncultured bacterium]|nr:hypothetical protein BAC3_00652 [uncultured bacterium]
MNNRVNEIDLLRFFAALIVVFFHYAFRGYVVNQLTIMPYPLLAPYAKYGYLGVQLFFMISGFVILMTAYSGSLNKFVISRMVRLYPAYWFCCTLTFIVILAFGEPRYSATWHQYLINLTMLQEFLGIQSIDGVYWTLIIELRFYFFIALILFFGKIEKIKLFMLAWLFVSVLIKYFDIRFLRNFFIIDYSYYFIAGAMYFLIWLKGLSLLRCGIAFGAWGLALTNELDVSQDFYMDYLTTINAFVILGIISIFFVLMSLIAMRKTGWIGRANWVIIGALTYPLYLLHENIGFIIFNHGYPDISPHLLLWGTILLMLILSYLVNTLVEKRFSPYFKKFLNYCSDFLLKLMKKYNMERAN